MNDCFQEIEATACTPLSYTPRQPIFKTVYNFFPAAVILIVLGFVLGFWSANVFHNQKITDSIKLQRFLYKTIVYNITPNVEITK